MNDTPQFTSLKNHICNGAFPTPFFLLKKLEEVKAIIIQTSKYEHLVKLFEIEKDLKSANHYIQYYKKIVEN